MHFAMDYKYDPIPQNDEGHSIVEKKSSWPEKVLLFLLFSCMVTYLIPNPKVKIAVSTINIGQTPIQNHIDYCTQHGYHYKETTVFHNPNRTATWQKFRATTLLFDEGYDFVFWLDGDAFITNCSKSLEYLINKMEEEKSSWLFSGDTNVINAGQMIWKNDQVSRTILNEVWNIGEQKIGMTGDNAAFSIFLGGYRGKGDMEKFYERSDDCHTKFKRRGEYCRRVEDGDKSVLEFVADELFEKISYVPQSWINSYGRNYRHGDFLIHLAGFSNGRGTKDELKKRFEKQFDVDLSRCVI